MSNTAAWAIVAALFTVAFNIGTAGRSIVGSIDAANSLYLCIKAAELGVKIGKCDAITKGGRP